MCTTCLILLQPFPSLGFLSCQIETVSSPLAAGGPGITCDARRDMIRSLFNLGPELLERACL